jgi:hypothetical protein
MTPPHNVDIPIGGYLLLDLDALPGDLAVSPNFACRNHSVAIACECWRLSLVHRCQRNNQIAELGVTMVDKFLNLYKATSGN